MSLLVVVVVVGVVTVEVDVFATVDIGFNIVSRPRRSKRCLGSGQPPSDVDDEKSTTSAVSGVVNVGFTSRTGGYIYHVRSRHPFVPLTLPTTTKP